MAWTQYIFYGRRKGREGKKRNEVGRKGRREKEEGRGGETRGGRREERRENKE